VTGESGGYGVYVVVNSGIIKDCKVDGKISYARDDWSDLQNGGFATKNEVTGKIMNCSSSVDISIGSRYKWAGGVVGYNLGLMVGCTYSGTISANGYGAMVERNEGIIINGSYLGNQEGLNLKAAGGGIEK